MNNFLLDCKVHILVCYAALTFVNVQPSFYHQTVPLSLAEPEAEGEQFLFSDYSL